MQTENVLKSQFSQSKKENLWNSNQSEGSNIWSEDIFPLYLLTAYFRVDPATKDSIPDLNILYRRGQVPN